MTDHWAIIPVKGLNESKTRLSDYLGDKRKTLVEALLHDVLASVVESRVFDTVVVISSDVNVATQTRALGSSFVRQTSTGLNRAVEQANRLAAIDRAKSTTIILADIPLVEPQDLKELFTLAETNPRVVMAPSQKGGTNVMMTLPPNSIRPSYGRWSYSKHLRQAQLRAISVYSMSNSRVSFDIDTVSDLMELQRRDPNGRTDSGRIIKEIGVLVDSPQTPSHTRRG